MLCFKRSINFKMGYSTLIYPGVYDANLVCTASEWLPSRGSQLASLLELIPCTNTQYILWIGEDFMDNKIFIIHNGNCIQFNITSRLITKKAEILTELDRKHSYLLNHNYKYNADRLERELRSHNLELESLRKKTLFNQVQKLLKEISIHK